MRSFSVHAATNAKSLSVDTPVAALQDTTHRSRITMPNGIAYLGVSLDDAAKDSLATIQAALQTAIGPTGHTWSPLTISQLHMTLFFAGEELGMLPRPVLEAWHAAVCQALRDVQRQSDFSLSDCRMRLHGLEVFPPEKQNLVVATFEVPRALHSLHERVIACTRQVASTMPGTTGAGLMGLVANNAARAWNPHCTLGKLHAPKGTVASVANQAIREVCGAGVPQELQAARSDGLLMCGAAPKQAKINWRSTLKFASEDEEDGNDVAGEAG